MDSEFDIYNNSFRYLVNVVDDKKKNGISTTYDNLTRTNIRKAVYNGEVKTEKYILLYLYDPKEENDNLSIRFLNDYGARLNNRLKSDIPVFTIYTGEAFKNWNNSLTESAKDALRKQFELSDDSQPKYELMQKLASDYKVSKYLPALVVIDGKGGNGYVEKFTSVSFRASASPRHIFDKVCKVLDAMDSNPNDFEAVRKVCEGRMGYGTQTFAEYYEQDDPNSFYNFLSKIIKKKDHSIDACAINIGITKNTLTDFMYGKKRIKPENLFALAFHLRLKSNELNWMFCDYSYASPSEIQEWRSGRNKRFSAILRLLEQGVSEFEVNEKLDNLGFDIIEPLEIKEE